MIKPLKNALDTAKLYKFCVVPVHGALEFGGCTCGKADCKSMGKHPVPSEWQKKASNDPAIIEQLFSGLSDQYNYGIASGKASGVFVVDIDGPEGERAWTELQSKHTIVPATLTSSTGRGRHLFFKYPDVKVFGRSSKLAPHVDVRGEGGQVVGPGSNHSSGRLYQWANPLEEIIAAPDWLIELVSSNGEKPDTGATLLPSLNITPPQRKGALALNQEWSTDDIKEMLYYIHPDTCYDDWYQIGMAIKDYGLPFSVWDDWSKRGTKYVASEMPPKWNSFKRSGVSVGTIYYHAKAGGYGRNNYKQKNTYNTDNTNYTDKYDPETGEFKDSPKETPKAQTLFYIPARDIKYNQDTSALIKDVLGQQELSVIYGESNCGKTFFMTDLAFHVARGIDWRGKRTTQGGVMYAALEGAKGLTGRFEAYCVKNGIDRNFPFALMPCALDFYSEAANISQFIDLIKSSQDDIGDPRLVVVDTLARALAGGDENSGQDMGRLVYYADMIRRETAAHLSFVHHSGKNKALGARGHSSLRAAVDTEIEISRDDGANYSTIKFVKQREIEMLDDLAFSLERVVIGIDKFTEELSSCVVIPAEPETEKKEKAQSAKERFVYEAIMSAVDMYGRERTPYKDGPILKTVTFDQLAEVLQEMGYDKMYNKDGETNVVRSTKSVRVSLRDKNLIGFNAGGVWLLSN